MSDVIKFAIVDDHPMYIEGVLSNIQSYGNIRLVYSGLSTEELIFQFPYKMPDIVLTGVALRGMDGVSITKVLKRINPNVGIIGLSVENDVSIVKEMLLQGANGFLLKLAHFNDIYQAVHDVHTIGYHLNEVVTIEVLQELNLHKDKAKQKTKSSTFSVKEKLILKHLCEGKSSKQIGDVLNIDSRTVEKHRHNLLRKTETNNPVSLAVFAVKNGLVED